jgi:hypothetical protein
MTNAHFQQLLKDFRDRTPTTDTWNEYTLNAWRDGQDAGDGLFVPHALLMPTWTLLYDLSEAAQPELMKLPVDDTSTRLLGDTSSRLYAGGWGYNVTTRPSDEDMAGFGARRREMKKIIEVFAERERQVHLTVHEETRSTARTFSPMYLVGLFHLYIFVVYGENKRKAVLYATFLRGATPKNSELQIQLTTDDSPHFRGVYGRWMHVSDVHGLADTLDQAFTNVFHVKA